MKKKPLRDAAKADQGLAGSEEAEGERRVRITISLSPPAAQLIRRVAFVRRDRENPELNQSAVIEVLIWKHENELRTEAEDLGG